MIQEANLLTTTIRKSITRNPMKGTEQPDQVSLPTEIGGFVKISVGIANPFRNNTSNCMDPTIQLTIIHSNQATVPEHSGWDYSPLGSLDSVTDVIRYRQNIDSCTGMNPQGITMTMIPESNSARKWLVPYLGGQFLDTDPDFGRYMHFCGTIIDIHIDRNPYKVGTQHYI